MLPTDIKGVYEALKKHGIFAVSLGLIILFQYNSYEELKQDNLSKQMEIKRLFEDKVSNLEQRLSDCEKQRYEDLIRKLNSSIENKK